MRGHGVEIRPERKILEEGSRRALALLKELWPKKTWPREVRLVEEENGEEGDRYSWSDEHAINLVRPNVVEWGREEWVEDASWPDIFAFVAGYEGGLWFLQELDDKEWEVQDGWLQEWLEHGVDLAIGLGVITSHFTVAADMGSGDGRERAVELFLLALGDRVEEEGEICLYRGEIGRAVLAFLESVRFGPEPWSVLDVGYAPADHGVVRDLIRFAREGGRWPFSPGFKRTFADG